MNQSYQAKTKVTKVLAGLPGALQEKLFPCLFQCQVAACIPWLVAVSPSKPAMASQVFLTLHHSGTFKELQDHMGPTQTTSSSPDP